MRIAFMTTVGRNVGDEFIREGIRSFFDEAVGAYEPLYVDKHDLTTLHRPVLDESSTAADKFRQAEVIVQAGAPVYWNNGRGKHTSYNSEWAQALWFERIFKLGKSKPIFNLGAGSGQKSEDDLDALVGDPQLVEFARTAGRTCAWTTTRDPLAARFLDQIGVQHELLPCPAFHAARRIKPVQQTDLLAVNLMPKAGHYRLKASTDERQWREVIDELLPQLRGLRRLIFVAHDQAEADFMRQFLTGEESIFLAGDYHDYLKCYAGVKGIVANRVHAAVCVAGFGRPAVIIGNDARVGIARPIGIPARDSADATADWIVSSLQSQLDRAAELRDERLDLRDTSAARYVRQLTDLLPLPGRERAGVRVEPLDRARIALAQSVPKFRPPPQPSSCPGEGERPQPSPCQGEGEGVVEDDNGFRFVMKDFMRPYARVLLKRKSTEGQNRALSMLIGPTDVVFDVGAHAGRFSVFVSRLPGFSGQIYAFEPVPQSFETLVHNLELNKTRCVAPLQYAITDRPAKVTMNLFPPEFSSWNSLGRPEMLAPGGKRVAPSASVQVNGESIDHFCHKHHIERINFLKVDVEGFEKSVFEGARRMLVQRRIDRICFEISRDPLKGAGCTAREVFQVLESVGYTVYRFDAGREQFVGPLRDSTEYWANYFAAYLPLPNSVLLEQPVTAAA